MPVRESEAIILRAYPFQEADLIVSFFTRDQGKLRGVAKRARRPKSVFGSGLERLSHVKAVYFQRETRELVNLDSCELIRSQFNLQSDYAAGIAMDYLAEVSEQLLPPAELNERHFRLLLAVLDYLQERPSEGLWTAVTYFSLWAVRLAGFLPELRMNPETCAIAEEMFEKPIRQLTERQWTRDTAADLRHFLNLRIEAHIERKLLTVHLLESI